MTRWTGVAMLAATLMFGGSAAIDTAAAASLQAAVQQPGAFDVTDLSARRRVHYRHYAYRSYDRPHYYDRPTYYRPYPYAAPVPFFLGFGFGPWW